MKIAVAGCGYVGLSNAVLLAQHHDVMIMDVLAAKIDQINAGVSPILDDGIQQALLGRKLALRGTTDLAEAVLNCQFAIIATPTNYEQKTNSFDTRTVSEVAGKIAKLNPGITIVIRSTVPVGFTDQLKSQLNAFQRVENF